MGAGKSLLRRFRARFYSRVSLRDGALQEMLLKGCCQGWGVGSVLERCWRETFTRPTPWNGGRCSCPRQGWNEMNLKVPSNPSHDFPWTRAHLWTFWLLQSLRPWGWQRSPCAGSSGSSAQEGPGAAAEQQTLLSDSSRDRGPAGGGSSRAAGAEGIWDSVPAGQGLMQLLAGTGTSTQQNIPNPCGIPTEGDLPSSPHCKSHNSRATDLLEI